MPSTRIPFRAAYPWPLVLLVACGAARHQAPLPESEPSRYAAQLPPARPACTGGDDCFRAGLTAVYEHRLSDAREAFRRSCRAEPFRADGCASFVRTGFSELAPSERADLTATVPPAFDRAEEISSSAHRACFEWHDSPPESDVLRGEACVVLGEALRTNERLRNRSGAAWTPYLAFYNACKLGNRAGCEAAERETERPPGGMAAASNPQKSNTVAREGASNGANLRMTGMKIDGIELDEVECKLQDPDVGGILGGIILGAGFKARKAQLNACSKTAHSRTRVQWTGKGGHMIDVKASGSDATLDRCVERALSGSVSTVSGTCVATVTHGLH